MVFREKVAAEARRQKELRAAGKQVSSEDKKYARISGGLVFVFSGIGDLLILLIGFISDTYYIFFILFFAVLSLIGLVQLISGRHFLNNGK